MAGIQGGTQQESEVDAGRETFQPSVSVLIPTLNAASTLEGCLASISSQRFPSENLEIIVADGGSTDETLGIAKSYGCRIVDNPLKTGEAGKARALAEAQGEIIALIDSDNILPENDWLQMMTEPFRDREICGTEPIEFTLRKRDAALTRYCALMGMNDPLCYFLGNYDRMNALTGRWTGFELDSEDFDGYLKVSLDEDRIPTIGANGFLVRKNLLDRLDIGDYLFDIDVVHELVQMGYQRYAKVKTGIVHLYGSGLITFARKQLRRIRDFSYYRDRGLRSYPWSRQQKRGLVRFVVYCLTVLPLVLQSLLGYARVRDSAWALHAPACLITLFVYGFGFIEGRIRPREQERKRWRQKA